MLNEAVVDWKSVALSHVATSAAFDAYLTEQAGDRANPVVTDGWG